MTAVAEYWIWSALGIALIALGMRDVFNTLLHPSGRGSLSRRIIAGTWRAFRLLRRTPAEAAGPLGVVLVILTWVVLQSLGWALVYLPHVPQGFSYSPGVTPSRYGDFFEATYVSLMSLSTLGLGDVVPVSPWIRLLAPLEALTGFALLTAAVSWFIQIYAALARRRTLALRLSVLSTNDVPDDIRSLMHGPSSELLREISGRVAEVRVDLGQNAETYYFREGDAKVSLARAITEVLRLADGAGRSESADVRRGGEVLTSAVEDLTALIRVQFLRNADGDPARVAEAVSRDHGHS